MVAGWPVGGDWLEGTVAWGKAGNLKLEEEEICPSWLSVWQTSPPPLP